jgi:type VI secretion system secreted protein VgrG
LPADKTVSLWRSCSSPGGNGFNEIRMDDLAGAERLWLHAQRDFKCEAGRNSDTSVGVNQTLKVGGGQSTSVGGDQHVNVAGSSEVKAAGIFFNSSEYYQVFSKGNIGITTMGERLDMSSVKHDIESKGVYVKGSDVIQLVSPTVHVFAGNEIHLQVGGSSIHITAGGIEINGPLVKLNC